MTRAEVEPIARRGIATRRRKLQNPDDAYQSWAEQQGQAAREEPPMTFDLGPASPSTQRQLAALAAEKGEPTPIWTSVRAQGQLAEDVVKLTAALREAQARIERIVQDNEDLQRRLYGTEEVLSEVRVEAAKVEDQAESMRDVAYNLTQENEQLRQQVSEYKYTYEIPD